MWPIHRFTDDLWLHNASLYTGDDGTTRRKSHSAAPLLKLSVCFGNPSFIHRSRFPQLHFPRTLQTTMSYPNTEASMEEAIRGHMRAINTGRDFVLARPIWLRSEVVIALREIHQKRFFFIAAAELPPTLATI